MAAAETRGTRFTAQEVADMVCRLEGDPAATEGREMGQDPPSPNAGSGRTKTIKSACSGPPI